jgi:deoxyribodipyrimidine photo-lyase
VLNPVVQGKRFDPQGVYVRRWVPELQAVAAARIHEPWRLPADERTRLDYPEPLIALADGLARFKHARGRD